MKMSGIKGSRDSGSGTVTSGVGKALTAMSGFRGSKDTGTAINTAGIGTAMTAMSIGRGTMAGSGTTTGESTIRIAADRPSSQKRTHKGKLHFRRHPSVSFSLVSDVERHGRVSYVGSP